ncbi:MAG: TolC family protein [Candidatus Limimorpha sp.]
MRKYILLSLLLLCISLVNAQKAYQQTLDTIEANSKILYSLQKNACAEKANNNAGSHWANPEFETGFLFGVNDASEHRLDLRISQEIDFPTVYSNKKKIRELNNDAIDAEYEALRNGLLFEAQQICTDLVYCRVMMDYLGQCLSNAQSIAEGFKRRLEAGEANILDYRNVQMNYIDIKNEYEMVALEREHLLGMLKSLNGGKEIHFDKTDYDPLVLPTNFDEWLETTQKNNPFLTHINIQNDINERNVRLAKSEWIPKINIGYMLEKESDGGFHGPTLGFSLPFWGNARTVNSAKAMSESGKASLESETLSFKNEMYNSYLKARSLNENIKAMNELFNENDSRELLKKALDNGEMTIVDYLLELEFYHEAQIKIIDLQYEFNKTMLELYRFAM